MAARPITMAPRPILTSAKPWYCASSPPESATIPFDTTKPIILFVAVFIPLARAIA